MSGAAPLPAPADDPVLDEGVLQSEAVLEIGGWRAVERLGGTAVLAWRADAIAAMAAGVPTVASLVSGDIPTVATEPAGTHGMADAHPATPGTLCPAVRSLPADQRFAQVMVRIGRGRAGTQADVADALSHLAEHGRLLVVGANHLGIGGWIRRLSETLGEPQRVHVRAKSRVAEFLPPPGAQVSRPELGEVALGYPATDREVALAATASPPPLGAAPAISEGPPWDPPGGPRLVTWPGVFSGDGLDVGTALLVDYLARSRGEHADATRYHPRRIADLGCGVGHLGIAALLRWPNATVDFYDGDARAVMSTIANLRRLDLAARATVHWWDAQESPGGSSELDLVLINPPAHAGAEMSLDAARAMIAAAGRLLGKHGRLLVVANQRLPYERDLSAIGPCRLALMRDGYKIMESRRGGGTRHG